jgi:hypothetical protein
MPLMMTGLVVQPSWLLVFRQAGSLHHNAEPALGAPREEGAASPTPPFHSAFRIPHSALRIRHSAFRIPHSAYSSRPFGGQKNVIPAPNFEFGRSMNPYFS